MPAAKKSSRKGSSRRGGRGRSSGRRTIVEPAQFELPDLYDLDVANCLDHISKIVTRAIGEVAREVDATPGQLQVIAAVARSQSGLTARQVADALAIRPGSLTGMLDQLEQRGAIARNPVPGDARQQMIVLQPDAAHLVDALRHANRRIGALLAPLGKDALDNLGHLATTIEDALREDIAQPVPPSLRGTSPERVKLPIRRPELEKAAEAAEAASDAHHTADDGDETPPQRPSTAQGWGQDNAGWRGRFTIASRVIDAVESVRRRRDEG